MIVRRHVDHTDARPAQELVELAASVPPVLLVRTQQHPQTVLIRDRSSVATVRFGSLLTLELALGSGGRLGVLHCPATPQ
jgi:hypothetical protein